LIFPVLNQALRSVEHLTLKVSNESGEYEHDGQAPERQVRLAVFIATAPNLRSLNLDFQEFENVMLFCQISFQRGNTGLISKDLNLERLFLLRPRSSISD
jgi:hypothetical protein